MKEKMIKKMNRTKATTLWHLLRKRWTVNAVSEDEFLERWGDLFRFVHLGWLEIMPLPLGWMVTFNISGEPFGGFTRYCGSTLTVHTDTELEDFIEKIPSTGFIFTEE